MSAESGEKSFDASPSRKQKARREGDVARSAEFGANCAFLCAVLATICVAPMLAACARSAIVSATHGETAAGFLVAIVACALVPVAAGAIGAAASSLAQTGGLVIVGVAPDFSKLSPAQGLKRMFSHETMLHGVRALIAFCVAMAAMIASLRDTFSASGVQASAARMGLLAWEGAEHAVFAAVAIGLLFSIAEYAVARKTWLNKLKMSLHEVKREFKEREGDPHARARRKSFHRNLIRGSIARVKDAAFVVVNPTHVAVALEYAPPEVPVPIVLVRASDDGALRVREEAKTHGVPIVENIPLARALFSDAYVGDAIPNEHYVAVAEIVAALTRSGVLQ